MLSKKDIQFITSLKVNKYRKIHQKFIGEGPKLVNEFLESSFSIDKILALPEWIKLKKGSIGKQTEVIEINETELHRISSSKTPNQVIAIINIPEGGQQIPRSFPSGPALVLDEIKDPGNMGTILRTADWFGLQPIICSTDTVDIYNPKVVQSSMGSLTRVNVFYTNLFDYFQELTPETKVYGAVLDGEDFHQATIENNTILLIGNESHGISEKLLPFLTHRITIPYYPENRIQIPESLNASIATAILCSEIRRK